MSTLCVQRFSTKRENLACVLRSLPCFAEPPAESPSTMKSSPPRLFGMSSGSAFRPVTYSARTSFRFSRSLAFLAASRAARARPALSMIPFAIFRIFLQKNGEMLGGDSIHDGTSLRRSELGFRLPFELRVRCPNVQNRRHSLPKILSREIFLLLPEPHPTSVFVKCPRVSCAETGLVLPPSC